MSTPDMSTLNRILDLVDDSRRDEAAALLAQYHDQSVAEENQAYRELADMVDTLLCVVVDDPNAAPWDGDESELEILSRFLTWAPDLMAHRLARKLRAEAELAPKTQQTGMKAAAESVEPFVLATDAAGDRFWERKRDSVRAPVPSPDDVVQKVTVTVPGRVVNGLLAQGSVDSTTDHGKRLLAAFQEAPRNRYGRGERSMVTEDPDVLETLAAIITSVSAGEAGEGGVTSRYGFAPSEGMRTASGIRAKLAQ